MVEAIASYAARLMARREASRLPTAGWAPPPTGHCADGRDSGPWTSGPIRLEASCRPTTHICQQRRQRTSVRSLLRLVITLLAGGTVNADVVEEPAASKSPTSPSAMTAFCMTCLSLLRAVGDVPTIAHHWVLARVGANREASPLNDVGSRRDQLRLTRPKRPPTGFPECSPTLHSH